MPAFIDLTSRSFGRLDVLSRAPNAKWGGTQWLCRCTCGNSIATDAHNLMRGSTRSCGCLHREQVGNINRTHSSSQSPEYGIWTGMKSRCYRKKDTHYEHYGARGIKVCAAWRRSFSAFLTDMGERPTPHHTLERADNDKDYTPDNCLWALRCDQSNNKRSTRWVIYRGIKMSLAEACRASKSPASQQAVLSRIRTGWTLHEALTTPPRR